MLNDKRLYIYIYKYIYIYICVCMCVCVCVCVTSRGERLLRGGGGGFNILGPVFKEI